MILEITPNAPAEPKSELPAGTTVEVDPMTGAATARMTPPDPEAPKPPAADPNRPAWLPEKFKSPEDMAKAYSELEKKLSSQPPATPPAPKGAEGKIDMDALSKEFMETGALSEASLKALEATGFTKAQVENYVAGQKALAEKYTAELNEAGGGAETVKAALEWAGKNLSDSDIEAYNAALKSGNLAQAKLALTGLVAQFRGAAGTDPSLVNGDGVPPGSDEPPFANNDEVIAAMRDKRYKESESYRAMVARRMAKTQFGQFR